MEVRELTGATVASIVHHGAFGRIREAYVALLHWIDANEYRQAGPMRELFLRKCCSFGDRSEFKHLFEAVRLSDLQ